MFKMSLHQGLNVKKKNPAREFAEVRVGNVAEDQGKKKDIHLR